MHSDDGYNNQVCILREVKFLVLSQNYTFGFKFSADRSGQRPCETWVLQARPPWLQAPPDVNQVEGSRGRWERRADPGRGGC